MDLMIVYMYVIMDLMIVYTCICDNRPYDSLCMSYMIIYIYDNGPYDSLYQ